MNRVHWGLLLAAVLGGLYSGCSQPFGWSSSGIPSALDTDALIADAGKSQGITVSTKDHGSTAGGDTLETERHFHLAITSGTSQQLFVAYRNQIENLIKSKGGTINGSCLWGGNEVGSFSYNYHCKGNAGIVKIYYFEGSDG